MPVLVVGADTPVGSEVVTALAPSASQLRAFASNPGALDELRAKGATVAIGDVSDASHLAGAALGAFSAVFIAEAAHDDRDRAFAGSPIEVFDAWIEAVRDAGIRRVIWVGAKPPAGLDGLDAEVAAVDPEIGVTAAVARVVALDEAADLA